MTAPPEETSADLTEQLMQLRSDYRHFACIDLNRTLIESNWNIGKILFDYLSGTVDEGHEGPMRVLEDIGGMIDQRFDSTTLTICLQFYMDHRDVRDVSSLNVLTWPHYRILHYVGDTELRSWYETQAISNGWSVHELRVAIMSEHHDGPEDAAIAQKSPDCVLSDDEFVRDLDVLGFLGANDHRGPIAEPRRCVMDTFADHLIGLNKGYSLASRDKVSVLKGTAYVTDLVFFNYILDCFILVRFIGHEPDASDSDHMIDSIDAFNRRNRPKGKKQTLGILIGYECTTFHITPAMKFNRTNIEAFYGTYHEYLQDFAGACDALMKRMMPEDVYIGMGCVRDR